MTEAHKRPPLERASWQRSVGAVLMRELFSDALSAGYELADEQHETVRSLAVSNWEDTYKNIPLMWSFAYSYVEEVLQDLKYTKITIHPGIKVPENSVLKDELRRFTYSHWGVKDSVDEAIRSMAAFPLSLARSVCHHVGEDATNDGRFHPRSLRNIADLLDSEDFRLMIEHSLVASNGTWRGFSTERAADLSTTALLSGYDAYTVAHGDVAYTEKAIHRLREQMKLNNRSSRPDDERQFENRTSSGCPARHLRPQFLDGMFNEAVPELEQLFGKDIEELTEFRPMSIVMMGLNLTIDILRQASDAAADAIEEEIQDVVARQKAAGVNPNKPGNKRWVEKIIYSSYR